MATLDFQYLTISVAQAESLAGGKSVTLEIPTLWGLRKDEKVPWVCERSSGLARIVSASEVRQGQGRTTCILQLIS